MREKKLYQCLSPVNVLSIHFQAYYYIFSIALRMFLYFYFSGLDILAAHSEFQSCLLLLRVIGIYYGILC